MVKLFVLVTAELKRLRDIVLQEHNKLRAEYGLNALQLSEEVNTSVYRLLIKQLFQMNEAAQNYAEEIHVDSKISGK